MADLIELFLLRRDITFLNHGSFGACPRPVFERYQQWQRLLEQQPVEFIGRKLAGYMTEVREALGSYLSAPPDTLIPVPNATFGVNLVAQSLKLAPGDEILSNDHEYGACSRAWKKVCASSGAIYKQQVIPLPISSCEELLECIWQGVTPRTKVLFVSHIASPTALVFPVEKLVERAAERGILSFIDGAHAPGHVDLNLRQLGADFYTGNCHKWLCAPKGAAFLYTKPQRKHLVKPLIVSWGGDRADATGDPYLDELEILGTDDPSAYLTIPAAIEFQESHNWLDVRAKCRELVRSVKQELESSLGARQLYPSDSKLFYQMAAVELPGAKASEVKTQLYDKFKIEVPVWEWSGRTLLRVSVQGYNTSEDLTKLVAALRQILT